MQRLSLFLFSLIILASANGAAQPALEIRSATTQRPQVELSFVASCDGVQRRDIRKQDFRLFENGNEIRDFTIYCPSGYGTVPVSVALVLDASGSMAGSWNTAAKDRAHAMVDLMDGIVDEATVTHFNAHAATYQEMTTIKPMLHSAIDALGSFGDRVALYDALYLNVVEVAFNAQNQGKALIVMTDSRNDSSYRSLGEVLDLAKLHQIPIYMIGFGDDIDATEMQMIADETGGRFFVSPNAGQMATIYGECSTRWLEDEPECELYYRTRCADGSDRQVVLEWHNLCGETESDTIHYTAPYDPSALEPLHLSLTADTVLAGNYLAVKLGIVNPLEGTSRPPFTFTLQYDTTLLAFPSASMGPEYLLDKYAVTITPVSGGVRIFAGSPLMPSWTEADAPLLKLLFQARVPEGRGDTIPLTIAVQDAAFIDSCAQLQIDDAQTVILAHGTSAVHETSPATTALQIWPNPGSGRFDIALAGPDLGVTALIVTDALGRIVLRRRDVRSGQTMTIDLAGEPAGLYNILLLRGGSLHHARYLLRK